MSAVNSTPPTSAARLRRVDDGVVSLLGLLLPVGFRARQRGEWTGDLMVLAQGNPAARWRYLIGAARTLPSLRRSIGRRDATPIEVPAGVRQTVARILLLGMTWPILSWLLWVPARYFAFDIPGRRERSGYSISIDPQTVWPFEGTPDWLLPLWIVPHFGAWAVVIGGPFLLAAVGVIGTVAALLRHRRRRVHRLTVAVAALTVVLVTVAWTAVMQGLSTHDDGYIAGVLGIAAAVLGATTSNLTHRTRVALLILGAGAIAVFLSFHTAAGIAMIGWFQN
ncbi:hypothetical protein [Micromonospora inyonensis]|uniref:Uncharacterized protein n=1 Tax=Micromonospora inyonensis TaxID=47866 RepID=A0A1C6SD50_9ACTN|nr:hypothetical protein [Micromonospora inyonensis]SCL27293.1 hypothetical protein GA0074694_4770 [Micromonospora inyonensis]